MSEATATVDTGATKAGAPADPPRRRRSVVKPLLLAALLLFLLVFPLYFDEFWLRTGFAVFAAVVGAIGLNLLVGNTGQLSLAHAFFLAVGAVTYTYVSATDEGGLGVTDLAGLGLPPVVGMIAGVLVAALAGLLFSPISARLGGIYLGVASLGLVFIGQHVFNSWTSVTGGFNGRSVPEFQLFGFSFGNDDPELFVMGVPFRESERLWYLGLFIAVGAYLFARNVLRSRPGRAIQTLRDSETAAAVMGVNVQAYKARAFMLSSAYAGLAGVLYALSIGSIAPESFGLLLSVSYLAMIVLGGLGSVAGAALGALFVTALPLLFQQYADALPFVSDAGQGGIAAGEAALYLYGLAIVLVIIFEPAGLAGLARRINSRFGRARRPGGKVTRPPSNPATDPST
ncbi:branched-chain amino acid ABC transporter permease [Blastococcus sp. BMG 814]|uniref:Branched-chain amino acid ABC transporter permease n=1 Tax=Blastococcus carthaginiensis TaxID=3050034 RepID=A0ABT9I9F3_9ACTN|nr:branched-chain amino acid ABC transporter permease [Blastococcus carthaginiensis]MDP5182198.1 branched-chain amino acid ABC transporter permease [Blastococcus carthaginiensis]